MPFPSRRLLEGGWSLFAAGSQGMFYELQQYLQRPLAEEGLGLHPWSPPSPVLFVPHPVSHSSPFPAWSLSHVIAPASQTSARINDGTRNAKSKVVFQLNWKLSACVERAPEAAGVPAVTSPPWHVPVSRAGAGGQEGSGIKSVLQNRVHVQR